MEEEEKKKREREKNIKLFKRFIDAMHFMFALSAKAKDIGNVKKTMNKFTTTNNFT